MGDKITQRVRIFIQNKSPIYMINNIMEIIKHPGQKIYQGIEMSK